MNSAEALAFHHVGLLTDDPESACRHLTNIGYSADSPIFDPLQGAHLRLCQGPAGAAAIELVTPVAGNLSLGKLLKRRGDYMYHVCFTAPSFDIAASSLTAGNRAAIVVVSEPKPAVLFGGARVAFYLVRGLGLVEILEQPHV
jgi:methylmalonyl-CoA/ethylmalonyl-CoA epimerase